MIRSPWHLFTGSLAKGADTAKSDIDLLIVGLGLSYSEVLGLLTDAEEKLGPTDKPDNL